jgi:adenylate kinase family enzyme
VKIAVVGTTCSGKTTVARRLAARYDLEHVELDALHWGPGWAEPSAEEFRAKIEAALSESGWVADGGYHGKIGDLVLERADLVVWLDLPFPTVFRRLFLRTRRRIRAREELWGGNRETWRGGLFSRDSLLMWAATTHRSRRKRYGERLGRFNTVRLRSPREVQAWLASTIEQ